MNKAVTWLATMAFCVATAAPALAAEDSIKIGVQGAHSGDLASYGVPSLNAVKIVVDKANAKGGVLGRKIEVISQDDQCKPEMATNAATKLISDKAVAVVGPICSGPTKASLPLFQQAGIIAISPTATTPGLTEDGKNPLFFRTVANDNAQAKLTSDFVLNKLKAKSVAYLHDNGDYGKGFADNNRAILEKAGVKTVLFEAVTPDAVDFSAVVRKLRRAKPDILVFGGYQPVASKLIQQMRRDHLKVPLIGPDGVKDETFLKMTGKDSEGTYASYPKDTSALPQYKEAREAHIKAFGSEPGFGYYNAYAATQCLLAAIEKAGSTDTAKLKEVLRNNLVDTPLGKINFNTQGDAAGMGLSIYQVQGGKFVELDHSITLN
ncbi:branched-chain amino acid ABC transporter substrate-binding protein [Desulfovibrio legallii]|uniref:branched-chain amino acid ABC transporter substrate-binding protein n=1 Tax=Desulfovibrio legallii TaxID=571438 RepID=UPI000E546E36|nr:branched-chain amino acid ABC transporter substrate-binding protein [Desulfovibrio legallii]RHH25806.1 branched-chain amino acid ABC transporter substrate-binding protein [Desulfovibrio sp. AM18-2]